MVQDRSRSQGYQYLYTEISFAVEMLNTFCNQDSVQGLLNPYHYSEDILDLEDELKIEFWKIVDSEMTDLQKAVIHLTADGYTQSEIAKTLGVNQSSITKSLNGNASYDTPEVIKYGGIKKKFQKLIKNNKRIQDILQEIQDLQEERY